MNKTNKLFLIIVPTLIILSAVVLAVINSTSENITIDNSTTEEVMSANQQTAATSDATILSPDANDPDIQKQEDCQNITSSVEEQQYGNCTRQDVICDDAPLNATCHISEMTYQCGRGSKTVEKTEQRCKTKAYVIKNKYKLNIDGYVCTPSKDNGIITVVCDSIYDGNGDGICTSGESCLKYVFQGNNMQKLEKNSRDEFTESDQTYFLDEPTTEVVQ